MDVLVLLLCTAVANLALQGQPGVAFTYPGRTLQGGNATCPPNDQQETIRVEIEEDIQTIQQQVVVPIELLCGGEGWRLSAYLNMTDPLQSCPSAWGVFTSNGKRACGAADGNIPCFQVVYPTGGRQYDKVCGRIIGYQLGLFRVHKVHQLKITMLMELV